MWAPEHNNFKGNKKFDNLAKKGAGTAHTQSLLSSGIPQQVTKIIAKATQQY